MADSGLFIVFDGIDGSGKSSQAARAAEWLRSTLPAPVIETRDPGSTPIGEQLRQWLLHQTASPVSGETEALLYTAARAQLVADLIRPALSDGTHVVCDRFVLSTLAYQGHGLGLPLEPLRAASALATGGLFPDLTVLVDVPVEVALRRLSSRLDRIESRGADYFRAVRSGFEEESRRYQGRTAWVAGDRPEDEVWESIREALQSHLPLDAAPRQGSV